MTPDEPEQGGQDVTARYHRASAAEGARPSETVRTAILAEARRIAVEQATPEAFKPFDTRTGAANQGRWRLAAVGTLGVAVLGALLMVPTWRPQPSATRALAPPPRANSLPADGRSARLADEARPPLEQQPAPALSAQAESAVPAPAAKQPSQDAARRQRSELPALDKSADTSREALSESARMQSRAAAAPPAAYANAAPPRKPGGEPRPLLQAVMSGDLAAASGVLDRGASLDAADDYGHSALFLAVMQRRADLVRLLLARGADSARADNSGQTPLDWARQHHFDDMVQLLSGPLATH